MVKPSGSGGGRAVGSGCLEGNDTSLQLNSLHCLDVDLILEADTLGLKLLLELDALSFNLILELDDFSLKDLNALGWCHEHRSCIWHLVVLVGILRIDIIKGGDRGCRAER